MRTHSCSGSSRRSLIRRTLISGLVLAVSACAPATPDLVPSEGAIVSGTLERGYTSVVLLYNRSGGLCTASIISPRVVLTARHCVTGTGDGVAPASSISLYVGSSERMLSAEYRAAEIHVIPGSRGEIGDGRAEDVALVVLASPAAEAPMEIARTSPGPLSGQQITAIGFGQTPTGSAGTKYRTEARVEGYMGGLIFVEPAVCSGDSGGPILGADGLIYGVASFIFSPDGRTEPRCGTAPGAYNEIFRHLAWIDGVLEAVGDSCIPDPEICDGLDNNCDEVVDEGCNPLGSACSESSTCIGGLCSATTIGQICTQECDTARPALGCPPGFYCGARGCEGRCVPGSAGAIPVGAACTVSTDCASLFCADPGDGTQRCLQPCRVGSGRCLGGEICVPTGDQCGGCVDEEIVSGLLHGLGEPCGGDLDCASAACREVAGIRECVAACADAMPRCPMGFTCSEEEELCVRNRDQGIGGPCLENADCGGGICALFGDRRWCTATCDDPTDCPTGFMCQAAGSVSVCAPDAALVGEDCGGNAECVTGLCAFDGSSGTCTAFCDADNACGAGFECRRTGDGSSAVCVRPSSGGCAIDHGARSAGLFFVLPALVLLALTWRRRR